MPDSKHGKRQNESVCREKNSSPPGGLRHQLMEDEDEHQSEGFIGDAENRGKAHFGNRHERDKEPEEEPNWESGGQDYDDDYEEDDQYPGEYDEYLEDGYEDDREKDYPEDYDLEYLKQFEGIEDPSDEQPAGESSRKSPLLRIAALVTVLAFLGLALAASWPVLQFPLAELVGRSIQLQQDIDVQRLQAAVVQIDVVSRRQGAPITAEHTSGTGFNIRPEGLIITNHHVIDGALNMTITFSNGKIYKAESWSSKPEYDLAVIKLQAEDLPVVPVNAGTLPAAGDKIRIVGNPLSLNNVVVEGEIDGYLRVRDNPDLVFSIDAPVYPGNSGSPVFDQNGSVVGVVFARYHRKIEGRDKIFGLAVPIEAVLGGWN